MENESEMTGTSTFTSQDREKLTTLSVDMGYMKDAFLRLEHSFNNDRDKATEHHDGLEERIRALEEFRWWIFGAAATAGVVAGLMGRALFFKG